MRPPASPAVLFTSDTRELGTSGGTYLDGSFCWEIFPCVETPQFPCHFCPLSCSRRGARRGRGHTGTQNFPISCFPCEPPAPKREPSQCLCQTKGFQTCAGQSRFISEISLPSTSPTVSENAMHSTQASFVYIRFNKDSDHYSFL